VRIDAVVALVFGAAGFLTLLMSIYDTSDAIIVFLASGAIGVLAGRYWPK
jgi:hypothetical protein